MAKETNGGDADETDTGAEFEKGAGKFFDTHVAGKDGGAEDDDDEPDPAEDDEPDDPDDEDPDDPDGDEPDDEEPDDDDPDPDDDDPDDEDEEQLDGEFTAAAERHRLPTAFEDVLKALPKDARPAARKAFQGRLKEVEGGFTRAMQEARRDRKTVATLKAEREYIDQNPIDHVVELMGKDPKFVEALNKELDKMENEAYAEAKTMRREDAKKKVQEKADALEKEETRREQRAEHVESIARPLARKEGIPFRLAERALYIAITQSPEGDVTDAQIRRIVAEEAKAYRKDTGQRVREDRKTVVRDKAAERDQARRRPAGRDRGRTPAPGRIREPKSLEEALTRRVAKMDFDGG